MQVVSARWIDTLQDSHQVDSYIQVYTKPPGFINTVPLLPVLKIVEGSAVVVDKKQAVRRRCTLQLTDPSNTLTPSDVNTLLAPFGNEVAVYSGLVYPDKTTEYVQLGMFGISRTVVDDSGEQLSITIDGYDRARRISRAKLTDVFAIAAGNEFAIAITDLIQATGSFVGPYAFQVTPYVIPRMVYAPGDDAWAKALALAASAGLELFFDAQGICVLRPEPDTGSNRVPDFEFVEGRASLVTDLQHIYDDDQAFNDVIREGAGTGTSAPVRGEVRDEDPSSRTYWLGPYGRVVDYASDSAILTLAQANDAASAVWHQARGSLEQFQLTAVCNPALDVNDIVKIVRSRVGVTENQTFVIDQLQIPLGTGSMTAIVRRVL